MKRFYATMHGTEAQLKITIPQRIVKSLELRSGEQVQIEIEVIR